MSQLLVVSNVHLKKGRMLTLVGLLKVLHVSASFLNNIFSTNQMQRPRGRSRLVRINFTSTELTQKKKLESLGIGTEKLFENSLVAVGTLSGGYGSQTDNGSPMPRVCGPSLIVPSPQSAFLLLNVIPGWHAAVRGTQAGLTEAEISQ